MATATLDLSQKPERATILFQYKIEAGTKMYDGLDSLEGQDRELAVRKLLESVVNDNYFNLTPKTTDPAAGPIRN
ncbi:hypothetical protein CAC42_6955 [Sphaceloma murrayae]|uniref:Uncharacterized protein n=1 Tax=Sphaceloma murrayae TaxID=2082308 RepID=A0A2K1QQF8_9PEZI|nr:hypothetical protein CAC42_6955 [Sphaceloma murrayae]